MQQARNAHWKAWICFKLALIFSFFLLLFQRFIISLYQKCFVQQELQAVKYSLITYVWSKVDVFFVTEFFRTSRRWVLKNNNNKDCTYNDGFYYLMIWSAYYCAFEYQLIIMEIELNNHLHWNPKIAMNFKSFMVKLFHQKDIKRKKCSRRA